MSAPAAALRHNRRYEDEDGPGEVAGRVLALDLGSLCGAAWTTEDPDDWADVEFAVWDLRHRGFGRGSVWKDPAAHHCFGNLFIRLEEIQPAEVAFELCRGHRGTAAAQMWGAWAGVVLAWCGIRCRPWRAYHTSAVKRFATGKPNASKEEMLLAAREKLHYIGKNQDEVDALWVLGLRLSGEG